jgi:protein-S-isoprenylcysteine O-methyltransferase Ste14
MIFSQANPIAMGLVAAGWIATQLGLGWRYGTLRGARGAKPAGRDALSIFFFLIQSASVGLAFWGPIILRGEIAGRESQIEIASVAVLVLGALTLFFSALITLGANFALVAQVREEGRLITSGPYALVRNPIYLAYLILLAATCLGFGHARNLVYVIPVYLIGAALRILREERVLREHFGADYDTYAARVKRLIPFIW